MASREEKIKRLNELSEEMKELYVSLFEDIGKDLEVLEIFRKSRHSVIHKDDDGFILSFDVHVNEVDAFKEWLENGKD